MSTATLDGQLRWRCRHQELNPHLQTSKTHFPRPSVPLFLPRQGPLPSPFYISVEASPLWKSSAFQFCPTSVIGITQAPMQQISLSNVQPFIHEHAPSLPIACSNYKSPSPCSFLTHHKDGHVSSTCSPSQSISVNLSSQVKSSCQNARTNDVIRCCIPELTVVSSFPHNCKFVPSVMHTQAAPGSIAVSSVGTADVIPECSSTDDFKLGSSLTCIRDELGKVIQCNEIKPLINTSASCGSTPTTNTLTYPASSIIGNLTSSSVPSSLESSMCLTRCVVTPSTVCDSKPDALSSHNSCSRSDSNLATPCVTASNYTTSALVKDQNPNIKESSKSGDTTDSNDKTCSLITNSKDKTCSLITDSKDNTCSLITDSKIIESISPDDGNHSSSDSGHEGDPTEMLCYKKTETKKHHHQDASHQEGHSLVQEELRNGTGIPCGESQKVQEKCFSPDVLKHVIGQSKSNSNSRGSVCGKSKGGCPRRRLIDDEGYIRRAACICVNKEESQVLLISSKKDRCAWLVPGGGLEVGEDPAAAATREAWEEAGVLGHIERYLGLFESYHHSGLKKHRTAVYIFIVTEEHNQFPEAPLGRTRQWFTMDEALLHLTHHRPLQSAYLQLMMMSTLKVTASS